jgi:GNAT superfamily N-acetyltransferase
MKKDEPFRAESRSSPSLNGLKFRIGDQKDREAIARLMSDRNPEVALSEHLSRTDQEILRNSSDPLYWLFVAEFEERVVGLCRYFHSSGLPETRRVYPAPDGWYCMGMLVDSSLRRKGVARFLFQNRLESMKSRGATVVYSAVDSENLTSIRMHEVFGYNEVARAPGFLHLSFGNGTGILYELQLFR